MPMQTALQGGDFQFSLCTPFLFLSQLGPQVFHCINRVGLAFGLQPQFRSNTRRLMLPPVRFADA
ncbi:hypothetical protein [Acetobacter pasteurianus]|uniref:hypothetical protein n=1 Tax=Acetobacter pasteurianus TaxID=438 RepID=UPI00286B6525|nr:hypothetical protein [Acetobacter pasteurianus]